jgi:D-alanyl-D-alanine carboxypeptidase
MRTLSKIPWPGRRRGRPAPKAPVGVPKRARRRSPWPGRVAQALLVSVAAAAGLAGGSAVGIVAQEAAGPPHHPVPSASPTPSASPKQATTEAEVDTLLAWTSGRLPPRLGRDVGALPGVAHVVTVSSGTAWLTSSTAADGTKVDRPPAGLAFPIEVAALAPGAFGPFLSPEDRWVLAELGAGEAVLSESEAVLRRLGAGATLVFGEVRLHVAGVLPDAEMGAHEVLVSKTTGRALGVTLPRYLLIDPVSAETRPRITIHIQQLLPPGVVARIRGPGETPYFRQGDAVLPPIALKQLFGEFAAVPLPGGYLDIDPAWVREHIVTAEVPILGTVRCNRAIVPMLQGALGEIEQEGLARAVHANDYGGCYSPRFVNRIPTGGISHHAWGVAIDINASANPYGAQPSQNRKIVRIFRRWGFTWGGKWLVPDGMHFEFNHFPAAG